jgi:2-phosphosulfolactate phosphatase
MTVDIFSQNPYRCRLDWGLRGTQEAAARGDIIVIVDTLSFSTAAVTAVHHGAIVYPCAIEENPLAIAQCLGAKACLHDLDNPKTECVCLSPMTYLGMKPDTRVVLASFHGATCSRYAREVPFLFVGALVNAKATADAVSQLMQTTNLCVTAIACGERWLTPKEDEHLRMAVEDYLGAGAILSYLQYEKSPEALVACGAFRQMQHQLKDILWECGSGRELREGGFATDVCHAAQLNLYNSVPIMRGDCLVKFDWARLCSYRL